jgi:hypothetical protein
VAFDTAAIVAADPAADRGVAAAAVERVEAGAGGTRYRPAIESALGLLAASGDGSGRIVVVTDLQAGGWDEGDRVPVPEAVEVEVADVGPLPENLALVGTRLDGGRVAATVANFGTEPRDARVTAAVDDRVAGEVVVTVGAGQTADATVDLTEGSRVVVTISDPDGFQADNARYLVREREGPPPVLVVSATGNPGREAFYIQQALAASGPGGAAFRVEGIAASALSEGRRARERSAACS